MRKASGPGVLRFVLVTVSTSKYKRRMKEEEVKDESGDDAAAMVERAGHEVAERHLISDDRGMLAKRMKLFLSGKADAVVFVGGTGASPDDLTIETVRPFLDKELEGFGEIFREESYRSIGSPAFLSRAVAGIAKEKLVVCLPGSPDAVSTALSLFMGQFPAVVASSRR